MYYYNTIIITFVCMVGIIALALLLYFLRKHFAGIYVIEGVPEIPKHCVDVRVVIVPLSSNLQKSEGVSKVEPQDTCAKNNNKKLAPLWSKIDLGSRHPPVFVDLNSLEYV